jgi:hypothetical protein
MEEKGANLKRPEFENEGRFGISNADEYKTFPY